MNAMHLIISLLAGFLLGGFYFWVLWLTLHRLPQTATAGFWLLASFAVRVAVVMTGIFLVSNGQWERITVCLVGFLIARAVSVRLIRVLPNPGSRKSFRNASETN